MNQDELDEIKRDVDYLMNAKREADRLRSLWESLDGQLKAVRRHAQGGQHVGTTPDFLVLKQHPYVFRELERYCEAALGEWTKTE